MLTKLFVRYLVLKEGATAIEYGLIAAGISVAISAVVFALGTEIETVFTAITGKMSAAATEAGS